MGTINGLSFDDNCDWSPFDPDSSSINSGILQKQKYSRWHIITETELYQY